MFRRWSYNTPRLSTPRVFRFRENTFLQNYRNWNEDRRVKVEIISHIFLCEHVQTANTNTNLVWVLIKNVLDYTTAPLNRGKVVCVCVTLSIKFRNISINFVRHKRAEPTDSIIDLIVIPTDLTGFRSFRFVNALDTWPSLISKFNYTCCTRVLEEHRSRHLSSLGIVR